MVTNINYNTEIRLLMKIGQIQRNKIYEDILKSVKGLLKEVHIHVQASVKASECQTYLVLYKSATRRFQCISID